MDELGREFQERFERARPRLRAIAYKMLGSLIDSEDALQETWLRLNRTDASQIEDLDAWLTAVTARVCLNQLRSRKAKPEVPLDPHLPDPVVTTEGGADPEYEAIVSEGVGLAMLVVLDTLNPPERLAFVLHDMFAVPFAVIAPLVERTPTAARQLASRARRRVADAPTPDIDRARQRKVVDAYFAAARRGDFEALLGLLHPDVVMRSDGGTVRPHLTLTENGADAVGEQASGFATMARFANPVLVNGAAGAVIAPGGRVYAVMGFVVRGDRIAAIDVLADPSRLGQVDPAERSPSATSLFAVRR